MAVEDGAVLGSLFSRVSSPQQLQDLLLVYEQSRKARTTAIVRVSSRMRDVYHCGDGDMQRERDRQLLHEPPFPDYPNPWADPVLQPWLFAYDADEQAEIAWEKYSSGRFGGAEGHFMASL